MWYVSKAALDSVLGSNFIPEDLSATVTLLTTRPRPVSQNAPQVVAKNTVHKWNELGRNAVFTGTASFKEGATPKSTPVSPNKTFNVTCNQGTLAQVTDILSAEWTNGGTIQLTMASETKALQDAIDEAVELATEDLLDDIEAMHILGDSTNPLNFDGGMTDGLVKWCTTSSNGHVLYAGTGGTSSSAPQAITEQNIRTIAQRIANSNPPMQPDTLLIATELQADINTFVGGGAGRPIVQPIVVDGNGMMGLTGGSDVSFYDTGYSRVKIERTSFLSPVFFSTNTGYAGPPAASAILYNKAAVRQANLIKMQAEQLARTGAAMQKMIQCNWAQEHRAANHTGIIANAKSGQPT